MKNFLKILLLGTGFLTAGLFIASNFNDPENPSIFQTIKHVSVAIRNTLQQYIQLGNKGVFVGDVKGQKEEKLSERRYGPENPLYMDDEEISESQKFFNRLAGLDPEELEKQKEDKKKAEEEALKAAEEAAKKEGKTGEDKDPGEELPESLWPMKRKRKGIIEITGHETGAIYNKGALPYGPPPFVKSEIFSSEGRLQVHNDPEAQIPRNVKKEDQDEINYGPDSIISVIEQAPTQKKINAPIMDHRDAYTVQLGAYETKNDARKMADRLITKGFNVGIYQGDTSHNNWYYVRLNKKEVEQDAMEKAKEIMEQHGIFPLVVPIKEHERRVQ
jgi:cell division septation protein DedD